MIALGAPLVRLAITDPIMGRTSPPYSYAGTKVEGGWRSTAPRPVHLRGQAELIMVVTRTSPDCPLVSPWTVGAAWWKSHRMTSCVRLGAGGGGGRLVGRAIPDHRYRACTRSICRLKTVRTGRDLIGDTAGPRQGFDFTWRGDGGPFARQAAVRPGSCGLRLAGGRSRLRRRPQGVQRAPGRVFAHPGGNFCMVAASLVALSPVTYGRRETPGCGLRR